MTKMKKMILLSMMAVLCLMTANAQKTVVSQSNQNVYDQVEQMPEFPGGMPAMIEFLQTNIKYPKDAIKQDVGGKVMVMFVVETDGSISNVRVARKVFPSLDKEAVRVVKAMPKWKPGKEKGRPVRVNFTLPVVFSTKK
ncbi:MAG: energy transducer TonB [Muribaculaceae bacterium]|nr:energy transducer TonB [Muribaculaceae bacterium]MBR5685289.1 energy transducer TonB [Muribaculaceae bacterium]